MPIEGTGKRRKCTLNPPEAQPQEPNDENRYGKNFAGKFCRCGRDYDPETETEAMLNCIGCEVGWTLYFLMKAAESRTGCMSRV